MEESKRHILSAQEIPADQLYETNDIKLATAFIASGHGLVMVRHVVTKRGGGNQKAETLFGFRQSQGLHDVEIGFLSGHLQSSASLLLETRDRIISYIANGQRSALNPLTEEVVSKSRPSVK